MSLVLTVRYTVNDIASINRFCLRAIQIVAWRDRNIGWQMTVTSDSIWQYLLPVSWSFFWQARRVWNLTSCDSNFSQWGLTWFGSCESSDIWISYHIVWNYVVLFSLLKRNKRSGLVTLIHSFSWMSASTVMRHLKTAIRSEKCVVRRFRRCANVIECIYTNLESIAYCC